MGILSSVGKLIGGSSASSDIVDAQKKIIARTDAEQQAQQAANQPFLNAGTQGINAYSSAVLNGPGELTAPEKAILDRAIRDTQNNYAAQGLNNSGIGREAILGAALRGRLGLHAAHLGDLRGLASFGPGAVGRYMNASQWGGGMYANAQNAIGQAKAYGDLNMWSQLGGIGEQALSALGGGIGGIGNFLGLGGASKSIYTPGVTKGMGSFA